MGNDTTVPPSASNPYIYIGSGDGLGHFAGSITAMISPRWKFCPDCGTRLPNDWKHCAGCGRLIGSLGAKFNY